MAINSPNMALLLWNAFGDFFNHEQLYKTFLRIDFHDHSPGRGKQVPTEGIEDGAITAPKLAPGANAVENASITTPKFSPSIPSAKVYHSASTALPNATETTLDFDSERFDTANLHNPAINPSRLTAPVAGLYMVTFSTQTSTPSTTNGAMRLGLYKNGTTYPIARSAQPTSSNSHTLTTFVRLLANEFVLARVYNNTGGASTVLAGSAADESLNDFGMVWIAP